MGLVFSSDDIDRYTRHFSRGYLLEDAIANQTPLEATDHLGVVHRIWPVTDVSVISAVASAMGPKPVFIADGHHRYETACDYRDQVYDSGFLSPDHPANFVLMHCVAMEDPGLIVLPTHRLFSGVPAMTQGQLAAKLETCFSIRPAGDGPELAILRLLGLFDRPADGASLAALREPPPIPGLTEALFIAEAAPTPPDASGGIGRAWEPDLLEAEVAPTPPDPESEAGSPQERRGGSSIWIESRTVDPVVAGSSPVRPAM